MLSCITLAHAVDGEVTTIEGLRDHPLVARVRPRRRRAVRLLHARPGRLRRCARRREPRPDAGRDTPFDGREHLPLRHVSQDRGGDPHRGATDPHREGGRGPVRGGLARRRGGSARAVARRPARRRRPPGGPQDRARAGPRRGALHRRHPAARDAAGGDPALAVRARAREADRPHARRSTLPGVRAAVGPDDVPGLDA